MVDGTRLKYDYPRFLKGIEASRTIRKDIFSIDYPEDYIAKAWLKSVVPVVFDFLDSGIRLDDNDDHRKHLYCLFPVHLGKSMIFAKILRSVFVNSIIEGQWFERAKTFVEILSGLKKEQDDQIKNAEIQKANMLFKAFMQPKQFRSPRRF